MENENITVAEGKPSGYKVTKKDLRNANWRWLMSVCTFNYQTQQGASVAYALSPILRKIYTNDEDYKQALNNHFRYYNTQPWLAAIILGACVAMEERDGLAAADAVQDLKIGTMGPLAGVGDSLLMTMIPTIMGSIAAYMAIEGNPVGAGIWFALILAIFWVRMHALEFGYKQGVKLVTDFSEKLPNLTAAASVLGAHALASGHGGTTLGLWQSMSREDAAVCHGMTSGIPAYIDRIKRALDDEASH